MADKPVPTREELETKIMDALCDPESGCEGMGNKRDKIKPEHDLLDDWNLDSSSIGEALDTHRVLLGLVAEDLDPEKRENARTVGLIANMFIDALERKVAA